MTTLRSHLLQLKNIGILFLPYREKCKIANNVVPKNFLGLPVPARTAGPSFWNFYMQINFLTRHWSCHTAQKMKFSIKDFFNKCNQICIFLRIWPHLLEKSLMENFIFCALSFRYSYFLLRQLVAVTLSGKSLPRANILALLRKRTRSLNVNHCILILDATRKSTVAS